jgi:ribosomal-protein-alanine N-acetyltransferase
MSPTAMFESQRLRIKCYGAGDGPMLYAIGQRNREHLQRYESDNPVLQIKNVAEAEALAREIAADWAARKYFLGAAFDKRTNEFVVQMYLGVATRDPLEFKIGFFVDKSHEGRGYVTEAVGATLEFAFAKLHAHYVSAECDLSNVRSYRVLERCGMRRQAVPRKNEKKPNGDKDATLHYAISRREFLDAQRRDSP